MIQTVVVKISNVSKGLRASKLMNKPIRINYSLFKLANIALIDLPPQPTLEHDEILDPY
jgi:hypothetical protein